MPSIDNTRELAKYKTVHGCRRCGNKDSRVIVFHHKDPNTPTRCVGRLANFSGSEEVRAEVALCDLLCANCHMIVHYELREQKRGAHPKFQNFIGPFRKFVGTPEQIFGKKTPIRSR